MHGMRSNMQKQLHMLREMKASNSRMGSLWEYLILNQTKSSWTGVSPKVRKAGTTVSHLLSTLHYGAVTAKRLRGTPNTCTI